MASAAQQAVLELGAAPREGPAVAAAAAAAAVLLPFRQATGERASPPSASFAREEATGSRNVPTPHSPTTQPFTARPGEAIFVQRNPAKHYVGLGTLKETPRAARTMPPSGPMPVASVAAEPITRSHGFADKPPSPERPQREAKLFLESFPFHSSVRSPAHDEILNRIVTPYDSSAIEASLIKHGLVNDYPLLIKNLRNGFPMGDFPPLHSTVIFPNHPSCNEYSDFVDSYLEEEVTARRMSGPFSQQEAETILKGHFQCSPIIISAQTQGQNEPDKLRLCRHLSKGDRQHLSTNAYIEKEKFPTKVGSATQVAEIVSRPFSVPFGQPRCRSPPRRARDAHARDTMSEHTFTFHGPRSARWRPNT